MPIYMQVDGIKGDVQAAGFLGAIELQSAQIGGLGGPPPSAHGSGARGENRTFLSDVAVTFNDNVASTELFKSVATGKQFPVVKISFLKGGGVGLKITMKEVLITSFSVTGGGDGQRPLVSASLNFAKIEFEYMKEAQSQNAAKDPVWVTKP